MVTVVIGIIEKRILKRPLSLKLEIVILGGFLFFACFQAWKDNYGSLVTLQGKLKTPEFGGELSAIASGTHMVGTRGIPVIFVSGFITNPLGPPSGLVDWRMGIKLPDSQIIWGESLVLSEKDQRGPMGRTGQTIVFRNVDYWPFKTVQPIAAGAAMEGWFWSRFKSLDLVEAYNKHATLIVEFKDVATNTKHTLMKGFPEKGFHIEGCEP